MGNRDWGRGIGEEEGKREEGRGNAELGIKGRGWSPNPPDR